MPQVATGAASVSDSHCQFVNCSAGIIAINRTGTVNTIDSTRRCRMAASSAGSASEPAGPATSGRRGRDPGAIAHGLDGATRSSGATTAGSKSTAAFSVAKLTLAETPSSRLSFFSIRLAQDARHAGQGEVDVSL